MVASCLMGWCLYTGQFWTYQHDLASPWTALFAHLFPGFIKPQQCPELNISPAAQRAVLQPCVAPGCISFQRGIIKIFGKCRCSDYLLPSLCLPSSHRPSHVGELLAKVIPACEPAQEKMSPALHVRGSHHPVPHAVVSQFPPVPSLAQVAAGRQCCLPTEG